MSRDIQVYAKKKTTVAIKDVLARLQDLGIAAEWKTDPFVEFFTKSARKGAWRAGFIVPEGDEESEDKISIATGKVQKADKEDLVESYADKLTDAQRQALQAAQTRYEIAVGWLDDPERERLVVGLADVLADLGDGLILDTKDNRFYTREEYRQRYAKLFKRKPQ